MDALMPFLLFDDCIQCAAEAALEADPSDLDEDLLRGLSRTGAVTIHGQAVALRVARRQSRLICRLILLEPHECGKGQEA